MFELIVSIIVFVLQVAVVCRAITRPHRAPASRIAWVAVITFLPVLGMIAYAILGETNIGRERVRRLHAAEAHVQQPITSAGSAGAVTLAAGPLFEMTRSINNLSPQRGNRIVLMEDSDSAIASLIADIDAAREQVHLSFYIWLDDHNGGKVADSVAAAAARGVQCRVTADALGSRAFIAGPRWNQLRAAGVHLAASLDDIPRIGRFPVGRVDLRNHRKIAVIDNRIAYCGSQNCADPAFTVKAKYAPWVDVFFRCEGPVVRQEQWLFLTGWAAETGEQIDAGAVNTSPVDEYDEDVIAAMFGTGPTTRAGAMSDVFVSCIYSARDELTISTPYFVPDEALLDALCAAPRRGVKTTMVVPKRNDSWFVGRAAYNTYDSLLSAGVELYEYPLGLLHSKTLTIDGQIALVGSANMDRRSLELNYENNLLIADPKVTAAVRARQQTYLDASTPIPLSAVQTWSFPRRLAQNTVAMLAPLL